MKGMNRHGLRAGRDFSVVGFDDSWVTDLIDPPLTTVRMPFSAVGRTAVQMLLDVLDGKELGDDPYVELASHLVVRASTASAAADSTRPGQGSVDVGPGAHHP